MIIVVNFERGGGVWLVLEGAWTLESKRSFLKHSHTVLFSYLDRILRISFNSLSLWKRPDFKSETGTSPQTYTLPNLLTTTRASHKTWALPSLLCLFLAAHLNLCSKIQREEDSVLGPSVLFPGLAEFERNRDIYPSISAIYVSLLPLSGKTKTETKRLVWDWVAVIIYMY